MILEFQLNRLCSCLEHKNFLSINCAPKSKLILEDNLKNELLNLFLQISSWKAFFSWWQNAKYLELDFFCNKFPTLWTWSSLYYYKIERNSLIHVHILVVVNWHYYICNNFQEQWIQRFHVFEIYRFLYSLYLGD